MAEVSMKRTYFDGPFGQVHCRVASPKRPTKPPLVCLHMSPKSGKSFEEILPKLATDRVVLAPDSPGHGESDPPPAKPKATIEDYAKSTWAAIDAVTSEPVHLLGYHTGSMVAVEATAQHPARVRSLILVSAPIFSETELDELGSAYEPIPVDEAGSRFSIQWKRVIQHRGPGVSLQMAAASFAENLRAGDDYEWGHRAAFAYARSFSTRLAQLEHTILVVNPGDDCHESTKRSDALFRNGRRIDFTQWGHGFMNAYPDDAARVFLEFLREIETS